MPPRKWVPGLAITVGITLPAIWLGELLPMIGSPVFGILLGIAAGTLLRRKAARTAERYDPGFAVAGKHVLHAAIVAMGFGLSLQDVALVGGASLPVMLGTLVAALSGAWALGRLLRLDEQTRTLIGVGTAICGASAIAMVTAVIRPTQERVAYALGTIFTFNIVAVFSFPALGRILGLTEHGFGLWAGTAINDTSSVIAAAYAFGPLAGSHAVVVKMVRSLMLIPICFVLLRRHALRDQRRPAMWRSVPIFMAGFLAASLLTTTGVIPSQWQPFLSQAAVLLITVALTGIGLTLDVGQARAVGLRPLLFGGLLSATTAVTSLALQQFTGQT